MAAVAVAIGVSFCGCGKQEVAEPGRAEGAKPVVYTTFYPTEYFTWRIAGDLVEAVCPVPEDEDAIFWMPEAEKVAAYQQADLIVLNGADFAKWAAKVSLPESRVVNTAKPFEDEFINFEHATVHSHGPAGEHAHEGLDGHTWVDPVNAKTQAGEIKRALVERFPEHKAAFEQGFAGLTRDLDALDAKLKEYREDYENEPLLASHPTYNYIARRYGWNIRNLDLDPEEMPSDETFEEIGQILEKHPAKYLIWEAYPTEAIAERMQKELGVKSIEFSPCELLSEQERQEGVDYLKVMRRNLENIREIFQAP
jgi:zinc transport system substrate-binding protein